MAYALKELANLSAIEASQRLLGANLIKIWPDKTLITTITECEAYDETDPSSHSYNGLTKRNKSMFLSSGYAYVYLIYGLHYCLNIVVGPKDVGRAVLIRAVKATNFNLSEYNIKDLNGPAKLTKFLAIDKKYDGHRLDQSPLILELNQPLDQNKILYKPRIGLAKSKADYLALKNLSI